MCQSHRVAVGGNRWHASGAALTAPERSRLYRIHAPALPTVLSNAPAPDGPAPGALPYLAHGPHRQPPPLGQPQLIHDLRAGLQAAQERRGEHVVDVQVLEGDGSLAGLGGEEGYVGEGVGDVAEGVGDVGRGVKRSEYGSGSLEEMARGATVGV